MDARPASSIDEAAARLTALLARTGTRQPRLAIAIEQFGVVHHAMALPRAADDIVAPIVRRELQRIFGLVDPVLAFTRGDTARGDSGPRQVMIAAAPSATIDGLRAVTPRETKIEIVTVVPTAMHALYESSDASREPTAALVVLDSGPHLAFFLDGRLELAVDPPIAPEGEARSIATILDQLERGALYFRQQFRGAEATRVLLAVRAEDYARVATAIEERFRSRVQPLFRGAASPAAVVAVGAALEARRKVPLDLFPHQPSVAQRASSFVRGPRRYAAAAALLGAISFAWGAAQVLTLVSARREASRLQASIAEQTAALAPMRPVVQRRADLVSQVSFVRAGIAERALLTRTLAAVVSNASAALSIDTVAVRRADDGWAASVEGTARGTTTTQAVSGIDALVRSIRAQHGVSAVSLDDFDYPKGADDSLPRAAGPTTIVFHASFAIRREASDP
jgi:hypothetical protein